MIDRLNKLCGLMVAFADLDSNRALAQRRQPVAEDFRTFGADPEPAQSGTREDDSVRFAASELREPCLDIPAQRDDLEVRSQSQRLRLPPNRARAELRVRFEARERPLVARDEHVM